MRRAGSRLTLAAVCALGGMLVAADPSAQDLPRVRPAPARPAGTASQGIAWLHEVDSASTRARERGLPMMVEFRADWCGPCHMLEQRTFSDPRVVEAARRFVPVRVDFDANPRLARRFQVDALPAVLFTDAHGTEIARLNGYVGPAQFLKLMAQVPPDVRPFNELSARLVENERDFEALLGMGLLFRKHAMVGTSTWYLQQAAHAGKAAKPAPLKFEEALYFLGENHLQERQWTAAIAAFTTLLERFPASERAPVVHLELGKAYAASGDRERARGHLAPLASRGERDPVARQAREILESL